MDWGRYGTERRCVPDSFKARHTCQARAASVRRARRDRPFSSARSAMSRPDMRPFGYSCSSIARLRVSSAVCSAFVSACSMLIHATYVDVGA
jgi:hypothetical protein